MRVVVVVLSKELVGVCISLDCETTGTSFLELLHRYGPIPVVFLHVFAFSTT